MGWCSLRNLSVAVLTCLVLAGCTLVTHKEPALTGVEARALSAEAVKARVLAQLGDNLLPFTPRSDSPVRYDPRVVLPLDALHYVTRPHASYEGWCAMEVLTVYFTPTVAEEARADTPMRAAGVYSRPAFFLLTRDPDPEHDMTPAEMQALQADCVRLDPYDSRFIYASSLDDAVKGDRFYREANAAIVSGNPPFELDCGEASFCQDLARRGRPDGMEVSACGSNYLFPSCYSITTIDVRMDIIVLSGKITKVVLRERIYLTSGN